MTKPVVIVGLVVVAAGLVWWLSAPGEPALVPAPNEVAVASPSKRLREALRAGRGADIVAALPAALDDEETELPPSAWTSAAEATVARGRLDLAERCYARGIATAARPLPLELARLRLVYTSGRIGLARDGWRDVLRRGSIDLLSLPLLANPNLQLSEFNEAFDDFPECPVDDVLGVEARARLALQRGRVTRAREVLRPLVVAGDVGPNAYALWGRVPLSDTGICRSMHQWF